LQISSYVFPRFQKFFYPPAESTAPDSVILHRSIFDFSGSQPFSAILFIWLYKY